MIHRWQVESVYYSLLKEWIEAGICKMVDIDQRIYFFMLINVKKIVILLKKTYFNIICIEIHVLNVTNHEMMYCILRSACVLSHPCDIQILKSFQLSNCLYYVLLQQTRIIFNNNGLLSLSVSKYFSINLQKQFRRSSG